MIFTLFMMTLTILRRDVYRVGQQSGTLLVFEFVTCIIFCFNFCLVTYHFYLTTNSLSVCCFSANKLQFCNYGWVN